MTRIAAISAHSCPLGRLGAKDTGGMNVYIRQISRELGQRGVQVDVFTNCHDTNVDTQLTEQERNIRVIHLRAGNPVNTPKQELYRYLPQFTSRVYQFQQKHDLHYDLIHSHYWLSGWVADQLKQKWSVPHLACFHTLGEIKNQTGRGEREPQLRIETEREIVSTADKLIAFSTYEEAQLHRLYGASPQKVDVIPCGVDLNLFRPIDREHARHQLGLVANKILLYAGRIEPLKGIDILLQAASSLNGEQEWQLLVVGGDGEGDVEMAHLKSLATQLGIDRHVAFLGPVPHKKLPLYYSAANVCVLPSFYESFGLVVLESLACATPVIASAVGEMASIIQDDETGYLVPPGRPHPLASRLKALLNDERIEQRMAAAARASVEKYSWPTIASQMLNSYQRTLARNQ